MRPGAIQQPGKTMVYTVDLGDGRVMDIEGPEGATPEQLQAVIGSQGAQGAVTPDSVGQPIDPFGQGDIGFASQEAAEANSRPPDSDAYVQEVNQGFINGTIRTPADLKAVAAKYGGSFDDAELAQWFDAYNKGTPFGGANPLEYPVIPIDDVRGEGGWTETAKAFGRGIPGSLGLDDELGAAVDTAINGGDYTYNLARNREIRDFDEDQHFWSRLGGQIAGGMALPSRVTDVAREAGILALRNGLGRKAAEEAARRAVVKQLGIEGSGYSAIHGFGDSDGNIGDRALGATVEAAAGGALGLGIGKLGTVVAARNAGGGRSAELAEKLNIPATPATTGGPLAGWAQRAMGSIPGGEGAVHSAVNAETEALADAARRVAAQSGPVSSPAGAGEALARGAAAYERATKTQATALYRARDEAFGGRTAPVDLPNSRQMFADLAGRFPTSPAIGSLREHPVIRQLESALPEGPLTLSEATEALSHVRGVLRNLAAKADASGVVISRVEKVRDALQDDIMRAAERADATAGRQSGAPDSAVAAQLAADRYYRDRQAALNGSLSGMRKSAKDATSFSAEAVYNRLSSDMLRKGGNVARLRDAWFRLPQNARRTFSATRIDDMGRATKGNQDDLGAQWSFNTFLSNFDDMSPQARKIVFGAEAEKQVQDIATYASRLRDVDKLRNFSNTARNLIGGALIATLGKALWGGDLMTAAGTVAAIPASFVGAKVLLSTPAMRAWTKSALRTAFNSSASQQASQAQVITRQLSAIAKADPAIANDVLQLQQRLVTAFSPTKVAAEEPLDHLGGAADEQNQPYDQPDMETEETP